MPQRPSIMDLPRQILTAAIVKFPRPPSRAVLAAKREAHRAACAAHLAIYPKLRCVLCHSTEAVEAFVLRAPAAEALPLAVPLCFSCREDFGRCDPRDYLDRFSRDGIDAYLLAQSLRYRTGELRLMELAIEAHTRDAIRQRDTLRVQLR